MERLKTLLIANRGEIAVRIIRTAKSLGVRTIAIYSKADAVSQHIIDADEAVLLDGPDSAAYTDGNQIINIARRVNADAIIPGYGFLSENADFARLCECSGICFVGPTAETIDAFGIKHIARELADKAGVPIVPGTKGLIQSADEAVAHAVRLGYPIMLKATGGGGGMGLITCHNEDGIRAGFQQAQSRGEALFKNAGVFMERYFPASHHIEVQIFGNGHGTVVHFGERECSIQRRHQKVIEECPSPFVEKHLELREKLTSAAIDLATSVNYESAGTVEYLVDDESSEFYFLEMNTRLQVEHGITEECYRVDLVELMLKQADARLNNGKGLPGFRLKSMQIDLPIGNAIEARIYAENPSSNFSPSSGLLQHVEWAGVKGTRIDTWIFTGCRISPTYDPMLAKAIVHAQNREDARCSMEKLLRGSKIYGPVTNKEYVLAVLATDSFRRGHTLTSLLGNFDFQPTAIQVISGGTYTLVQDNGRPHVGHGIPRAGAMDPLAHQIANILVGNEASMEALEILLHGPELFFHTDAIVSVTGAEIEVGLDGRPARMWSRIRVKKDQTLKIGRVIGNGCRAYLALYGGILNIAPYFDSKSCTPFIGIGGYQGRQVAPGDLLSITSNLPASLDQDVVLPTNSIPKYSEGLTLDALPGPYGDGYLLPEDLEMVYQTQFVVSHNASRAGIRLIGPVPKWARSDGGDGGSHPSNIQEYGYSTGALNWTGDEAVILPNDSPNFGGFISCAVTVKADWWKLGQAKPGTTIRFNPVSYETAWEKRSRMDSFLSDLLHYVEGQRTEAPCFVDSKSPEQFPTPQTVVLWHRETGEQIPEMTLRQAGDDYVLLEFGDGRFDLNNLLRVSILEKNIRADHEAFIQSALVDIVLGCNSMMVHFDAAKVPRADVISYLKHQESVLMGLDCHRIMCRKFKLPLTYDSMAQQEANKRYMETQRPYAPYLPDNLSFVAESNAISPQMLKEMLLSQELIAFNVGFFCGSTVFLPIDPRHRIVSPKTNPSRVYTPAGSVAWGGSCMAIYPVDSPGGFQMLGRTVPYFDMLGFKPGFTPNRPWLYENFDIISFYEVTDAEMESKINLFNTGQYAFDFESIEFDMAKHNRLLRETSAEVDQLRKRRAEAQERMISAEKESLTRWRREKSSKVSDVESLAALLSDKRYTAIESPLDANVWKVHVAEHDVLDEEQTVCVLEAMKMEVNVNIPKHLGKVVVQKVNTVQGTTVRAGHNLFVVRTID